ncbi:hypothetical protein BX600DRAFT_436056 [Xylariales sp. PMI_506]|nr:hypothetical protein BX600DRAFT_436056 [Xylariales sp. PMI_506]
MTEVSATRLYLGNLPKGANMATAVTKEDVQAHFATHGTGEITEIKLMNGFGFIEYKDAMDARDVVPAFHGSEFMGQRLTVQFARGSRNREGFGNQERAPPRPRRTPHRMQITGLPNDTSWQDLGLSLCAHDWVHWMNDFTDGLGPDLDKEPEKDPSMLDFLPDLKDFARQSSLDVVYSETGRDGNGRGSFVEFETAADLRTAIEKLDGREFKGQRVTCVADPDPPARDRYRSRSPRGRGGPYNGGAPPEDYRRGPPKAYSPRREDYRDRSPRPRGEYYDDRRYGRSPPRRGPPMDDYPPPRGRYDDPYRRDYGPPPDPYGPGGRGPYDRPPRDFPPREAGYGAPRDGGYGPRDGGYPRDDYRRGGSGGYW